MFPERLVLYGDERVLEIVRKLIVLRDLTVLIVIDIAYEISLVIIDVCADLERVIYLLRVDLRSVRYGICRVGASRDPADDDQCEQDLLCCKEICESLLFFGLRPLGLFRFLRLAFKLADRKIERRFICGCLSGCLFALSFCCLYPVRLL